MTKIGIVSDIHLGFPLVDDYEIVSQLERLSREFKEHNVDTVISLGDQIHEVDKETDKENLQTVVNIFDEFDFYALAGNHDLAYMSVEEFSEITGTELNEVITIDGTDIILLDTASENKFQNVGEIHPEGFDLLKQKESSIVFTHFLISYTSIYLSSEFFNSTPEGVFAVNKYHLTNERMEDNISIESILTGHLHIPEGYQFHDELNVTNSVAAPFIDLSLGDEDVFGYGGIYDLEEHEYTLLGD